MGEVRSLYASVTRLPTTPWQDWTANDLGERKGKTALVIRYGAFGDMIFASSIFPELREQGYRVVVNTTDRGYNVIRADPHVDEVLIQAHDAIPNEELREYWDWIGSHFDRVIQLSESIENNLLPTGPHIEFRPDGTRVQVQGQDAFDWPHEKRHALLNRNYIEETHRIAGVPFTRPRTAFYPTPKERQWASRTIRRWKRKRDLDRIVMIVLSGSSVHKSYPYMDNVMANVLVHQPRTGFVLVGDDICKMLEDAWVNERRVFRRCGEPNIRKTMALAQQCDVVVGPETGVMNAVGMEPMQKILFLSHSSVENACRDWVNTKAVAASVPCYPCHKMHHSMATCVRDEETHGALCQARIPFRLVAAYIMGMPFHERSPVVVRQ